MPESGYIADIIKIRAARDARIRTNPRNWLSLAGLYYLKEGINSFGNQESLDIHLPMRKSTLSATLLLEGGVVRLAPDADPGLTVNGNTAEDRPLRIDQDGDPDLLRMDQLEMMVIKRGERFFLRVWDLESENLKAFNGFSYFPVDPDYRIVADFNPYKHPKPVNVENVIGTNIQSLLAGEATFSVNGTPCKLLAEMDEEDLLFSFTDLTTRDVTYPGGRYFTSHPPEGGRIVLDFNLAVNWPCAYTPYATCPVPPAENRLPVRIEAGEKRFLSFTS